MFKQEEGTIRSVCQRRTDNIMFKQEGHTLVSNIIRISSFDGSSDLSMSVGNNITDAARDLIISVGHNITYLCIKYYLDYLI